MGRFGPRTAAIEGLLDELGRARWLAPASEPPEIEAQLAEHLARVAPLLPIGVPTRRLSPIIERSFANAASRWESAWAAVPHGELAAFREGTDPALIHADALVRAAWLAYAACHQQLEQSARIALDDALAACARASCSDFVSAGIVLGAWRANWLAGGLDPDADPLEPLLKLALAGTWPLVLPSWQLLVYVPGEAESITPGAEHVVVWGDPLPLDALGITPMRRPLVIPGARMRWRERAISIGVMHTIGRHRTNDLVVDSSSCARRHALVACLGNEFWLVDTHSHCGIYDLRSPETVQRLPWPHRLQPGDELAVGNPGDARIRFEPDPDAGERPGTFGLVSRALRPDRMMPRAAPPLPEDRAAQALAWLRIEHAPHADTATTLLASIDPARWFAPEPATIVGDPAGRARIEALWREHHRLLAPLHAAQAESHPRVELERSLIRAWTRWNDAWESVENQPYAAAPFRHLHALEQAAFRVEPRDLTVANVAARYLGYLEEKSAGWTERVRPFLATHWGGRADVAPMIQAVVLALAHVIAGATTGSPWSPLMGLFALGVWPLALPGGDAIVWLPQLDDHQLPILNPDQADVPSRRPRGYSRHEATEPIFVIDNVRRLPVLLDPRHRRERVLHNPAQPIEPRGVPRPAHLRVVGGDAFDHGTRRPLGAATHLDLPPEVMRRFGAHASYARPDAAHVVFRDRAYWVTAIGPQFPAISINGAQLLYGHRPLDAGDQIDQGAVRYVFELE